MGRGFLLPLLSGKGEYGREDEKDFASLSLIIFLSCLKALDKMRDLLDNDEWPPFLLSNYFRVVM